MKIEAALTNDEVEAVKGAIPTPGAVETIKAAVASGRKVGIVSNNALAAIETYRDLNGLTEYVDVIEARTGENVTKLKPDPYLLQQAPKRVGIEPSEAVFIGDQISGIIAAQAAHVSVIGYANKRGKQHRFHNHHAGAVTTDMTIVAASLGSRSDRR